MSVKGERWTICLGCERLVDGCVCFGAEVRSGEAERVEVLPVREHGRGPQMSMGQAAGIIMREQQARKAAEATLLAIYDAAALPGDGALFNVVKHAEHDPEVGRTALSAH